METAVEHLSTTLRHAAASLAAVADDVRTSRAELRRDYICGGWVTPDLKRRLSISKLPDGYRAVLFMQPPGHKRMRPIRILMRVQDGELVASYGDANRAVITDPLRDSITLPGYGTFYRDDLIFG